MAAISSACSAYFAESLYRATIATRAAPCAACSAAVAPPPGAGTRAASCCRNVSMVSVRTGVLSSAAEAGHLRVDERLRGDGRPDPGVEVLDLDSRADGRRGGEPGIGDRPA